MKCIVFGQQVKTADKPVIENFFKVLQQFGLKPYLYGEFYEKIKNKISFEYTIPQVDSYQDLRGQGFKLLFSLGGDGTILKAATLLRDMNIPILGINMGRLGFLATSDTEDIQALVDDVINSNYDIENRSLLELESNFPIFGETPFALNDMTILKRDTSSMILIKSYINGIYLNSYWADGIIIATPTGSTGYSLSCGGPIILPSSQNFVITPVAPHNLTVRPIVIPDTSEVSFQVEGRTENFLCTLDSRVETITSEYQIKIRKANFTLPLVKRKGMNFPETIREKLNWGKDFRN